jgi:hypothetical protein
VPNIKHLEYIKKEHAKWVSGYFSKPVDEYSLDGKYIKTWNNIISVEKELGIHHSNISLVIKGKRKTAGNRIWKEKGDALTKKEVEIVKNTKNTKNPRSIIQYDKITGNEIRRFDSSYSASKILGIPNSNILKVCNGKINKTKGFYFKYE